MSSDSDDLKGKFSNEEEDFSDDQKNKEKVSIENSQKKMEEEKKKDKKEEKEKEEEKEIEKEKEKKKDIPKNDKIKEEKDSDESSDESEKNKEKKKKKVEDKKDESKKEDEKDEDEKEEKKDNKKNKRKKSDSSGYTEEDDDDKKDKESKNNKKEEVINTDKVNKDDRKNQEKSIDSKSRNFDGRKKVSIKEKIESAFIFDKNEVKTLNRLTADNIEIINEMKLAFPGFTQLECASIFKKIKSSTAQTIFEIMNLIHKEISIKITLKEYFNKSKNTYLTPSDPFEIVDKIYSNPEHVKMMKYYKIYSEEDKNKLPPYITKMLSSEFYYENKREKRRKVVKYSDGSFNYIPVLCDDEYCDDEKCPFSHNDNELNYHPLFYKTKYQSGGKKGYFEKNANNFYEDFRIIYNYKNENIINLLKLLDEKKIAKYYFKDYYKKEMKSFKLETFKTMECASVKSGIKCPKDAHLCYYYHNLAEKRRPPTLYRYSNVMCPDQKYKENGKIKSNCKNGDFCNKCHSRYEYYYHKLFFGKAITCMRPKKNGKCIFEETCYGYHPYKEKDYKKTREEKIQEKKDELMDKYTDEFNLLNELISNYKCHQCNKYYRKFKYYIIVKCGHIICEKCFKDIKNNTCPKCQKEFEKNEEGEGKNYILMDFKKSALEIDKLLKKNYSESHKENEEKNSEDMKEDKDERNKNNTDEMKKDSNNAKDEKSDNDDDNEINNSMG